MKNLLLHHGALGSSTVMEPLAEAFGIENLTMEILVFF
jgi:hypothetical protein